MPTSARNTILAKETQSLIDDVVEEITEVRRDLHQHPELGFEEHRTSQIVARWLEANEFEFRTNVAGTGIIGLLRGKAGGGKTVALRADMDALPLTEETGASFSSTNPGKAHACGHDGHTAILLGAAKVLSRLRTRLEGNVKLIFQPAEEGGAGGRKMCEDGVLENPKVDAVFALHSWPDLEAGEIGIRHGVMTSNSDRFAITMKGKGGHAAHPHKAIDPIVMSAEVINSIQTIVSRRVSPVSPAVVTIGKIQGGSAPNVIPDHVTMEGTIRTFDESTRETVSNSIKQIAESVATMFGAELPQVEVIPGYPATINHEKAVHLVRTVGEVVLSPAKVKMLVEPSMGAEDFSYYLQTVPGALFRLGVSSPQARSTPLHSSQFNFNDDALRTGVIMMVSIPMEFLGRPT